MKLTKLEEHWDNKTLDYDLSKFNWSQWALDTIREVYPNVDSLEEIHTVLDSPSLVRAQKHVQDACLRPEFMKKFDEFVAEVVPQRICNKRFMVQRQGTLRLVIPDQSSHGRRLSFHQGVFVGNGRGLRTIWTPLTECGGTNTMWIADLENSRRITREVLDEKWDLATFENECVKYSYPVTLVPGQSHLFTQEHLHGNVDNKENYTRASIDMRILIEGEEFGRKYPGGYFRLPGDYESTERNDYSGKHFITYAGWNSNFSRGIPLGMQRSVIDGYCTERNIAYSDYQFENEYMDWQPGLESFIKQKPYGIVLCSMHSLTDDSRRRDEILKLALDRQVELHFANEVCSLRSEQDLERIQTYLNFAVQRKGKSSWE